MAFGRRKKHVRSEARDVDGARALRVLLIHTAKYSPLGAGPWVHALALRNFDRRQVEAHVAVSRDDDGVPAPMNALVGTIDGVERVDVDFGPESLGRALRGPVAGRLRALGQTAMVPITCVRLAAYARRHRIDLVHTDERPRDALAAVLLGRVLRVPSVVHVHVAYGDWMSGLLTWSMRHADRLVAVSEFVARTLRESGHERVDVVLNSIDLSSWQPGVGRDAVRHEFAIPEDAPVVVTVCRIGRGKGPTELLRCVAAVSDSHPDLRVLVVGAQTEDDYRMELERMVVDLGLRERVVFTGRRSDVPALMAAADVYAMPSVDEPFGLVWLEAMAMELPVLALANGGTIEVVERGVTGFLTPTGDVAAMTENLLRLLRDPDLRRRMGEAGRARVESGFTGPRLAADVTAMYGSVVAAYADRKRRV
jgi:glycosyltransferase involved in cell wall biosynthesis